MRELRARVTALYSESASPRKRWWERVSQNHPLKTVGAGGSQRFNELIFCLIPRRLTSYYPADMPTNMKPRTTSKRSFDDKQIAAAIAKAPARVKDDPDSPRSKRGDWDKAIVSHSLADCAPNSPHLRSEQTPDKGTGGSALQPGSAGRISRHRPWLANAHGQRVARLA